MTSPYPAALFNWTIIWSTLSLSDCTNCSLRRRLQLYLSDSHLPNKNLQYVSTYSQSRPLSKKKFSQLIDVDRRVQEQILTLYYSAWILKFIQILFTFADWIYVRLYDHRDLHGTWYMTFPFEIPSWLTCKKQAQEGTLWEKNHSDFDPF